MPEAAAVVNYGLNKLRFPSPVPVGSRVRLAIDLQGVEDVKGGVQAAYGMTFEIEGGDKPACVAEVLFRVLPVGRRGGGEMREAEQAGVEAAEALEPEGGLVAALDPMAFGGALLRAAAGVARNPVGLGAALGRLSSGLVQTAAATTARAFGADSTGPLAPDSRTAASRTRPGATTRSTTRCSSRTSSGAASWTT